MILRALLVLALAILPPLATADHVFSHRLYVTGRLVDAGGLPWPNVTVEASVEGLGSLPRCNPLSNEREVTGPRGDFLLCRHAHGIPAGAKATVTAVRANATREVDPALRHVVVDLQSPLSRGEADGQGDLAFNATFRVETRVFRALRNWTVVEGVPVMAVPVARENVSVELRDAAGATLANGSATTDDVGDATADLAVGAIPPGATVRVRVLEAERIAEASPAFRRATVPVALAAPEAADPFGSRPTTPTRTTTEPPPGTITPTPAPAWVALAAVGLGAALLRKRS